MYPLSTISCHQLNIRLEVTTANSSAANARLFLIHPHCRFSAIPASIAMPKTIAMAISQSAKFGRQAEGNYALSAEAQGFAEFQVPSAELILTRSV
jgi:hypothetical protein